MRKAMTEPGENWIDETYERKAELGPLPGWELPLEWTSPDVTADKKVGSSEVLVLEILREDSRGNRTSSQTHYRICPSWITSAHFVAPMITTFAPQKRKYSENGLP